jgi:hypothetical protein
MKTIDFSLPDQNGKNHKLSSYKGSWMLLVKKSLWGGSLRGFCELAF